MDRTTSASTESDAEIVNYMPGMPPLSAGEGAIRRALRVLFARRGALRPADDR